MSKSNREKQRQFGLKLLIIAIIVALVFTVWYLSEKRERNVEGPVSPIDTTLEMNLSGENAQNLEEKYLEEAKLLMLSNYEEVQLSRNFNLEVLSSNGSVTTPEVSTTYWESLSDTYGELNVGTVNYDVSQNLVRIYFETEKDGNTSSFLRLVQFEDPINLAKGLNKPVLVKDTLINMSSTN